MTDLNGHSFGVKDDVNPTGECLVCGDGRRGVPCCHSRYSAKQRRFVQAHLAEFLAAHYNPDKRYAQNILARLARELDTLPPRHVCWCVCPNVAHGRASCEQCKELQRNQKPQEPVAMGRTGHVQAPMPSAEMLDLMAGLLAA